MTFVLNSNPLTSFGDLRTAELSPIFQYSFEYTVDNTELTDNTVANGGTVTQANAMALITSSTTTASTALMQSVVHAKYAAGLGSLCRFSALFTTGVAATEQFAGIADKTGSSVAFKNGLMIGFDGITFGFHRFVNDAKVTIAQSAWDDPLDGTGASGMTLDPTKLNVWEIGFQYLGAGEITLYIEDSATGEFVKVHSVHYANANTTPSSYNPNYHYTVWVDNKGTTSNIIVKTASCGYFVEGKTKLIQIQQPQFSTGKQQKTTVTTEVALFTIKNKTTYASKDNFISTYLEFISASVEASTANNLATIRLVKNATLGGSPSYTDINTSDSTVSIDTAGTTVTGGKELMDIPLAGKNDKLLLDLTPYDMLLEDGDTLTVSVTSSNSSTFDGSMLWKELV